MPRSVIGIPLGGLGVRDRSLLGECANCSIDRDRARREGGGGGASFVAGDARADAKDDATIAFERASSSMPVSFALELLWYDSPDTEAILGVEGRRSGVPVRPGFRMDALEGAVRGGRFGLVSSREIVVIRELTEGSGLVAGTRTLAARGGRGGRDGGFLYNSGSDSGSEGTRSSRSIALTGFSLAVSLGRIGVGERSSRRSSRACDCILLALRAALILAAATAAVACCTLEGDLSTARRAAICPTDGGGVRPLDTALGGGRLLLAANKPILSLTEPTSGAFSESISRRRSACRFRVLATAALAAAEGGEATLDDALELEKAIVAPCNAELFRGANRGLAAAISPFISPVTDPARAKTGKRLL
jgi:hypothetical protein